MSDSFSLEKSRQCLEASEQVLMQGCQGHKRNHDMIRDGYPVFTQEAKGAYFWDVDGNRYLDFLLGYGPIVLGHNDPVVNAALREQMEKGTIYSTANPLEIELCRKIIEIIPCAEKVCMFIGGSAATSGCVRIARGHTHRDIVLHSGYHGWHSWAHPDTAGIPEVVGALSLGVPADDLNGVEEVFKKHPGKVALWILEADGADSRFLQEAVELCHRHGALIAFDEIKVGFRMAMGGAGEYYGVAPDLATYGKACGNGYPGSFVVGKKEIMDDCGNPWMAATFHCDMMSMVAMLTVISELEKRDGIAYQWKIGQRLMDGYNRAMEEAGLECRLTGVAPMPKPTNIGEVGMEINRYCLHRGFYFPPGHPWFLSLSHSEEEIDAAIGVVMDGIRAVTR